MARKFLNSIDLSQFELRNAVVQNLATAPTGPKEGQLYYDTAQHGLFWYNGSGWALATGSGAVSFGSPVGSAVGDTANDGTSGSAARADHRHAREGFGVVSAATSYGVASANGTASTVARSDHNHGSPAAPAFGAGNSTTSAVGDAAGDGAQGTYARSDHRHGREAFAAPTAQTAFGAASSAGVAATLPRSDHTHGTPTHDNAAHSAINISALAAPTADVSWGSHKITNLLDPTNPQDAASKAYVDATSQGLAIKGAVDVATTANLAALSGEQTIDGFTTAASRVLVKNQATAANNGIYLTSAGAWTRTTDFDGVGAAGEVSAGAITYVRNGTVNGGQLWVLSTTGAITVGTTALAFTQFSGASTLTAGNGLTASGNTFNIGAGTGITVTADSVAIDTTVVTRKYATTIGDGAATSIVVTHNLGTQDVVVGLYNAASPFDEQDVDVQHTSTTTVTLIFAVAPAANSYRVVVHG